MRLSFLAFVLATTAFSPAIAAEIKVSSHIDAVTVYPRGADVERVLDVQLPAGETDLVLSDLPGEVDARTIRVTGSGGEGLTIGSVDSRKVALAGDEQEGTRKNLEKQKQSLEDEKASLEKLLSDVAVQKKLILGIQSPQLNPITTPDKTVVMDSGQIGSLIDLVGSKLNAISKTEMDVNIRLRTLQQGLNDLAGQMRDLARPQQDKIEAVVHVSAPAEMSAGFKVKYRVKNASWVPFYDARLTIGNKEQPTKVEIVRRADILQATPENWENVALTLSTANTQGATEISDIEEQDVFLVVGDQLKASGFPLVNKGEAGADFVAPAGGTPMEPPSIAEINDGLRKQRVAAVQSQAETQIAGFQALYAISDKVTLDNTGTAKKLRISTENYDAKMTVMAAPEDAQEAYLTAVFTMKQEAPLLPGRANLYRDDAFIGEGEIPQLNIGEEVKLGFGVDDLIKVERHDVKKENSQFGGLTAFNNFEQAWQISVKNLHDFTMPVVVVDQIPYSEIADVIVTPMADMTVPTTRNYNNQRGVYAWAFDLEPHVEKIIKFGDKITWPRDMSRFQTPLKP